jgi:hypothetical protein
MAVGLPKLEGKTVLSARDADADAGIVIVFTDGSVLDVRYSFGYGETYYTEGCECPDTVPVAKF